METEEEPKTPVLNQEVLYRSVRDSDEHHGCDPKGQLLRLGNSAFNCPDRKPSVNRESLSSGGPEASRLTQADGIVMLLTEQVRSISAVVTNDKKGAPLLTHNVDVVHAPVPENYAHAQIEADPRVSSDGAWKKLKEALCRIALLRGWVYPPASARSDSG
jgi:hypothetical protein